MQHTSCEPAGAVSAVFKVPVETWRSIFHFCLGPSCSDPSQDDLLAYRRLFPDYWKDLAHSHQQREHLRGRISCVCRSWRDIVADMGNGLFVIGPTSELTWPPGRERKQVKRIVHLSAEQWATYRHILQTPSFLCSLSVPSSCPETWPFAAPVVNLVDVQIEYKEDITSEGTSSTTVKALDWTAHRRVRLQGLRNPMFRDLVALKIQVNYPFEGLNHSPPLSFPSLCALLLRVSFPYYSIPNAEGIARWSAPHLKIFSIDATSSSKNDEKKRLQDDVSLFLRAHAHTIEELAFSFQLSQIGENIFASMSFPRLRSCQADGLDLILLVIASLEVKVCWKNNPNTVTVPRVKIYQMILSQYDFEPGRDVAAKLERYSHLYRHVHIQAQYPWRSAVRDIDWDHLYGWNRFFRAVEDGGGIVEDVEGNTTSLLRSMFPSWRQRM